MIGQSNNDVIKKLPLIILFLTAGIFSNLDLNYNLDIMLGPSVSSLFSLLSSVWYIKKVCYSKVNLIYRKEIPFGQPAGSVL